MEGKLGLRRVASAALCCAALLPLGAFAGDAGTVTADAKVLLAHTARLMGADPGTIAISGVTVTKDDASFSWRVGSERGRGTLELRDGRWWMAAPQDSAAPPPYGLNPLGVQITVPASQTAGYLLAMHFASNDAPAGARIPFVYGRAPTKAEFLPYPVPFGYTSDSVFYFDVTIDASKPVTFAAGTTLDVWFPFVLDDTLRYNVSIGFAANPIGPIYAKAFDNTLHFVLPAFTALPGRQLMAEIDGDRH